jgi:hypothetical protein
MISKTIQKKAEQLRKRLRKDKTIFIEESLIRISVLDKDSIEHVFCDIGEAENFVWANGLINDLDEVNWHERRSAEDILEDANILVKEIEVFKNKHNTHTCSIRIESNYGEPSDIFLYTEKPLTEYMIEQQVQEFIEGLLESEMRMQKEKERNKLKLEQQKIESEKAEFEQYKKLKKKFEGRSTS